MHGHDRLGLAGNRGLELGWVHGQRHRFHIDEDGTRAGIADRSCGCDEGQRNGDHFIIRTDAGRAQRQMQRAGAGVDGDRVLGVAIAGEFLLETRHFLAKHIVA
jgi:hypothetical protein